MQGVLKGGDEDPTAVVPGDLGLLDQRDCRDQGLDGARVFPGCGVLDGTGDGGAGDGPVAAHDLLELWLRQTVRDRGCDGRISSGTMVVVVLWGSPAVGEKVRVDVWGRHTRGRLRRRWTCDHRWRWSGRVRDDDRGRLRRWRSSHVRDARVRCSAPVMNGRHPGRPAVVVVMGRWTSVGRSVVGPIVPSRRGRPSGSVLPVRRRTPAVERGTPHPHRTSTGGSLGRPGLGLGLEVDQGLLRGVHDHRGLSVELLLGELVDEGVDGGRGSQRHAAEALRLAVGAVLIELDLEEVADSYGCDGILDVLRKGMEMCGVRLLQIGVTLPMWFPYLIRCPPRQIPHICLMSPDIT